MNADSPNTKSKFVSDRKAQGGNVREWRFMKQGKRNCFLLREWLRVKMGETSDASIVFRENNPIRGKYMYNGAN